jgi:transcriptional regulator
MMTMKEDAEKKPKGPQADLTHQEIADELGLTRAAVSLIEKNALAKIKRALRARYNIHQSDDLL